MAALPCADRCPVLADRIAALARANGSGEAHERLSIGLSPQYVPLAEEGNEATAVCVECGAVFHGNKAGEAARTCAEFDVTG